MIIKIKRQLSMHFFYEKKKQKIHSKNMIDRLSA